MERWEIRTFVWAALIAGLVFSVANQVDEKLAFLLALLAAWLLVDLSLDALPAQPFRFFAISMVPFVMTTLAVGTTLMFCYIAPIRACNNSIFFDTTLPMIFFAGLWIFKWTFRACMRLLRRVVSKRAV